MMSGENLKCNNGLISVIVPVYNASNDLRRCLDSLLRQTYTAYEVLLINDGSTDDSGAICDAYVREYTQFQVYHIKNSGVSFARNTGIEMAKGSYITFVDADDYVDDTYLELLFPPDGEDFAACGVQVLSPSGSIGLESISETGNDGAQQRVINHHLVRTVWAKMFKRSLISRYGIKFDVAIRVGEDTLFVLEFLNRADSVFVSDQTGYIYIKPGYKVNKYRTGPDDLLVLYAALYECEIRLKKRGFDVSGLEERNRNVVGFNLLTALYLVKRYSAKTRSKYIRNFRAAGKSAVNDMGLPHMVAKGMRFVERSGSQLLVDRFLFFSMKMIWLKARMLKN